MSWHLSDKDLSFFAFAFECSEITTKAMMEVATGTVAAIKAGSAKSPVLKV